MKETEKIELNNAINKLSEEDQMQIASGQKITDDQCEKLKPLITNPAILTVIAYGCPVPVTPDIKLSDKIEQRKQNDAKTNQ